MIALVPIYPYSCHPDDVMLAQEAMHQRYVFSDVQMRGYYPAYTLKEWARKGYHIQMEADDAETVRNGCADYVGFSYYMSNAVKHDASGVDDPITGFDGVVKNPHVGASDWGWQIVRWGCAIR